MKSEWLNTEIMPREAQEVSHGNGTAYLGAIVAFTLILSSLVYAAGGAKMQTKPVARAVAPKTEPVRVCTLLIPDGTVQGRCDRWEWSSK